jgi:hypothetical protein
MTNDLSFDEIEFITNEILLYVEDNSNTYPQNINQLFEYYLNANIDDFEFGSSDMVLAFHLPTFCDFSDEQIIEYEGIDPESINDQIRIDFVRNSINNINLESLLVINIDMYKLSNENISCFLCGAFNPTPAGLELNGDVSIFSNADEYYQYLIKNSFYIFTCETPDWEKTDHLVTDEMILSFWKAQ